MKNYNHAMDVKKIYSKGEIETMPVANMTKAEYKTKYSKGCMVSACGTYRQKTAPVCLPDEPRFLAKRHVIFLTDSKEHMKEEA
jgi:hypothetical protein